MSCYLFIYHGDYTDHNYTLPQLLLGSFSVMHLSKSVCVCVFWVRIEIQQGDAKECRNVVGWRNGTETGGQRKKTGIFGSVCCHEMPAVLVAAGGFQGALSPNLSLISI